MENNSNRTWNYRIGLDLGIASVGWAAIQANTRGEPEHIIDLGVRTFDAAEDKQDGSSLAAARRQARSARRTIRRRRFRLKQLMVLLQEEGVIDNIDKFSERYHSPGLPDVYKLRCEALDRMLNADEWAQVLVHLVKHRGFQSNSKSVTRSEDNGAVLQALKETGAIFKRNEYRTVGEMLYRDEYFKTRTADEELFTPRNRGGDYKHMILRSMVEEEAHTIFASQREMGNPHATARLEEQYVKLLTAQRSYDAGPGPQSPGKPSPYVLNGYGKMVGSCTFEPGEKRAPKASFSAELFTVLQKINSLVVYCQNGEAHKLTANERALVLQAVLSRKEMTYYALRKMLCLADEDRFNFLSYNNKNKSVEKIENTCCVKMPHYYEFRKILGGQKGELPSEADWDLYDSIAKVLTEYKTDDNRTREFMAMGIDPEHIEALLMLNSDKYLHLSNKALKKIIPYLMEGDTYDKACERAGYDFKGDAKTNKMHLLKGTVINQYLNDITNPVVRRSVSQTIKVLNALIIRYGSPVAVNIELARELAKPRKDRDRIADRQKQREQENEELKQEIRELTQHRVENPRGLDIVKYRLWKEQNGYCLYSTKKIPFEILFAPGLEVDHILPYSLSLDDGYHNKALVFAKENQDKGNRTPYEYLSLSPDKERWEKFEALVGSTIHDPRKKQRLMKHHVSQEESREFMAKNLNDTQYSTRLVYNLVRQHLELAPIGGGKIKQVWAVNGSITAYLRKRWGFPQKDRSTDLHHALDAVVVACCTDGIIHKITQFSKGRELRNTKNISFINEDTGEIQTRSDFSAEQWDMMFGAKIPKPWKMFREEVELRMSEDPRNALLKNKELSMELRLPSWIFNGRAEQDGDTLRPIFVSRMPNHKVTGAANKDTLKSPPQWDDSGQFVVKRVPLTMLRLNSTTGEIDNYYNPESDVILYNAIKTRLAAFNGNANRAFAEEFRKPKSDGTPGPIVRKVKIIETVTSGVALNAGRAFAGNGKMIRTDVYKHAGKYYLVPVYVADTVKDTLPTAAATSGKPRNQWKQMDVQDFRFSLYPNDLLYIESSRGVPVKGKSGTVKLNCVTAYYRSMNINGAKINGRAHDGSFTFSSIGVKNLTKFEKRQVDVLGYISIVTKEHRRGFS